jgi:hypothetical protein
VRGGETSREARMPNHQLDDYFHRPRHFDDRPTDRTAHPRRRPKIRLRILREALTTIHAGLYRYQTPAQFDAGMKELERKFESGATQSEVFLAISEFTTRIKCGHTFPSFWNNPIQTQRNLFTAQNKLPVTFRWMNGQMVITRNDSDQPALSRGTLITEVNGIKTHAILARLMKLVNGDGSNDAKRIAELQLQDLKEWEAFDVYYSLAFQPTDKFTLKIQSMGGETRTVTATAIDYKQRRNNRTNHMPKVDKDGPEWRMEWLPSDTAKLNMPTWALYNSKWDWKTWLKEQFVEMKNRGTKNLILDIRGNVGGNECGDEIMPYLVPGKVSRIGSLRSPSESKTNGVTWPPCWTLKTPSMRTSIRGPRDPGTRP